MPHKSQHIPSYIALLQLCVVLQLRCCQATIWSHRIAICMQAALNYEENLSGQPAIAQRADYTLAQHIMQTEREAVLCQSLHRAASSRAAGQAFRQPLVVGVIGEAHLEGIAELWQDGKWQAVLDEIQQGEELCGCPAPMPSSFR